MALAQVNAGDKINASDINQFYNILKGVAASGESVTLIYNAAGAVILQPSSDPATGTELIQIKNNAGTVQMALSSDGKVYAGDGTAPLPGVTWEQDKDTGFYRITANTLGIATNGVERLRVDTTGVSLDGGVSYLNVVSEQVGKWAYNWSGQLGLSSAVTGTGGVTVPVAASAGTNYIMQTGATSGSTVGAVRTIGVGNIGGAGKVRLFRMVITYSQLDANTNSWAYITDEGGTGSPTNTVRHLGIRQAGATFFFSTADGTTEQTTDISAFIAVVVELIDITYDGTTARCYVNGTLRATHATNVPSSTANQPSVKFYITNTAAANKRIDIDIVNAVFSD